MILPGQVCNGRQVFLRPQTLKKVLSLSPFRGRFQRKAGGRPAEGVTKQVLTKAYKGGIKACPTGSFPPELFVGLTGGPACRLQFRQGGFGTKYSFLRSPLWQICTKNPNWKLFPIPLNPPLKRKKCSCNLVSVKACPTASFPPELFVGLTGGPARLRHSGGPARLLHSGGGDETCTSCR